MSLAEGKTILSLKMEECKYCTERTTCEECHSKKATVYCHKHKLFFCELCYTKRHPSNISFLGSHTIDRLQCGGKLFVIVECPNHPDHYLDSFCTTCHKFVCSKCFMDNNSDHKGHTHIGKAELIESVKSENEKKIDECKQNLVELDRMSKALEQAIAKADENTKAILEDIDKTFEEAINSFYKRKEELKRDVEGRNNAYKQNLYDKKEYIKKIFEETEKHQFHGQRAMINSNLNDAKASFDHINSVKSEMEKAISDASVAIADAKTTKQEEYSFKREDIVAYIKGFGEINTSKTDIPYSNIEVNIEDIDKKSTEKFNNSLKKQFSDLFEHPKNDEFVKKDVIPVQPQQQGQPQPQYTSPPPPPQPQYVPITSIESPKVFCTVLKGGAIEISWTVDPKVAGLNYYVGLFVGKNQIQNIPNGSTSYVFNAPLPRGTKIYVAIAYNNISSGYGMITI